MQMQSMWKHTLFEEVPSVGIAGDMVMALCSPNFHVAIPEGAVFTNNLAGTFCPIGKRRPKIKQRLSGFGITINSMNLYQVQSLI